MKLSDRDLVAIIKGHRESSLGGDTGDVGSSRARAMDHYHGRAYGNEVAGRSAIVSKDLMEAVDWAMPSIIRAFVQSGRLGEFTPVGPEDEQLAQQESDYLDQVMMKDNPGFMILHDVIKDTLLLKNGYVKHFWEVEEKVIDEDYSGLAIEQLQKLLNDLKAKGAEVEILGQDSKVYVVEGQPVEFFDVKLRTKKKCGKMVWMAVPTEEVRVSKRCRGSLQDSPFTEHVTRKTRSDLIEMGMDRNFVDNLPSLSKEAQDTQENSRDSYSDETDDWSQSQDKSMDEIEFCEAYLRVDYDGDGVAELRKVVTCCDRIPPGEQWNETIPSVPMTGFVMKRVPHRHIGESLDDELSDLQEIQTALKRQLMDNIYLTNNSQWIVNERVNLKDFLSSTPGGVKRVKGDQAVGDAVVPVVATPILDKILPAIDYWDKTKEIRTGIRPGADMDPDVLKATTKGAYMEHLNRASQKIEMITRMIAESGVKEAVLQCHAIIVRHQDQPRMVQMRGKWIEVNPQEWKERTDLTVRVGLGTGNEEEKRQKLLLITQLQDRIGPHGLVGPNQMYALFADIATTLGFDVPEKYAVTPGSPEFQQLQQQRQNQPNPEVMKLQQQAQLEQQRMQLQQQTDQNRQEMEARQQQAKMQMEMAMDRMKAQMDMQLEREKAQLQAQLDLILAKMNNEAKLDAAQITAQATLTAQQEQASDNAVGDTD